MVNLVTIGAQTLTSYTKRTFNSLQFSVFYGIFERTVDFLRIFFLQLKWPGRIYMLTAVSGSFMASVYLVAVYQSCALVSSGVAPCMLWLAIPY